MTFNRKFSQVISCEKRKYCKLIDHEVKIEKKNEKKKNDFKIKKEIYLVEMSESNEYVASHITQERKRIINIIIMIII